MQSAEDIGSLRRWQKVADEHVINHLLGKRTRRGHLWLLSPEGWEVTVHVLSDRGIQLAILPDPPA
jgi:hypothetical protein